MLFQLPPNLKKDLPRLTAFLRLLPSDHRAAFEFRNDSWFADDVYDALKGAGAALCLSEREDNAPPPLVETAPWGYVRLRLEDYCGRRPAALGEDARGRGVGYRARLFHARADGTDLREGVDGLLRLARYVAALRVGERRAQPGYGEIDERANVRRQQARVRIDKLDRQRRGLEAREKSP